MNKKSVDLGTGSVGKLLVSLAIPSIIGQLVNLLYNIVDRIFIGRMPSGDLAMAGVGIVTPIVLLVAAFSALIGFGGAPLTAIKMGEQDNDGAEKIMSNSFAMLIITGVLLTIIFFVLREPIVVAFGASDLTKGYALDYLTIYLIGTVFVQIALGMNAFINTQGFAKIGMFTVAIGAAINIILDPIFIFTLNMGVKGAALATIISQSLSMIWILFFLTGKKTTLKIRKKHLRLSTEIILPSIALGLSPFIMQSTESLIAVCFNSSLLKYGGDIAVGAMTILTSVMQFSMLPLTGLTQGGQPIISYNFGAKNADRVKKTFKLLLISCLTYSTILWAAAMISPQLFVLIFNNDPELVDFASHALRIYMAVSCIFGIQIACQQTFIALGNAKASLFLALLRKVILLIPLIYIMPIFMADKTTAVFMSEPVADILAVTTTSILFIVQFKKSMKEISTPLDNTTPINA